MRNQKAETTRVSAAQQHVPDGLEAAGLVGRAPGERIMGTETEYGVIAPGSGLTPTQLSAAVVTAMGEALEQLGSASAAAPWDYLHERPLDDARGFSMRRADAHESQLTHEGTSVAPVATAKGGSGRILMNSVLGNGARFYVDHAHPEYSSPETTNSYDAAVWDQVTAWRARRRGSLAGASGTRFFCTRTMWTVRVPRMERTRTI